MLLISAKVHGLCSDECCFVVHMGFWFKDVLFIKSPVTAVHSHVGPVWFHWAATVGCQTRRKQQTQLSGRPHRGSCTN